MIKPLEKKLKSKHQCKPHLKSIRQSIEEIVGLLPSERVEEIEKSMNLFKKILETNTQMSTIVDQNGKIKHSDKVKKIVESLRKIDWGLNMQKSERMNIRLKN